MGGEFKARLILGSRDEVLSAALEAATDSVIIWVDSYHRIVRWSASATRLLGHAADEVLGRGLTDVVNLPKRASAALEDLRRGEPVGFATDFSASVRQFVWHGTPVLDGGAFAGAIYRVIASRSAQTLEPDDALQSLKAEAFMCLEDPEVIVSSDLRVVAVNRAFAKHSALARGRALEPGENLLAIAAPGTERALLDHMQRASNGQTVSARRHVVYPNGQEFAHLVHYTPLPSHHVLFGSKLSPIEELPLALLGRALGSAPFTVLLCDAHQHDLPIVYASKSVERLTGYSAREVLGKNGRFFQGNIKGQPELAVIRRAIADQQGCDVVLRNERNDGTFFLNRLVLSPLFDETGTLTHFVGIQEDVTEVVKLRDRLLMNESSQVTLQLLAGTIHDLRNALAIALNETALVLFDSPPGSTAAVALERVNGALLRASHLTRLLLSPYSPVRAGPSVADLTEVVATIRSVAQSVLPGAIRLVTERGPVGATLTVGDRGALERVGLNLVLNARDAMANGGVITMFLERRGEAQLSLCVRDTGAGMSEEVRSHLFEPYFTTKSAGHGTGLGLSTSRRLVESMGGTIEVESAEGRGSTFRVVLHRVDAAAASPPSPMRRAPPRLDGLNILVLEQDPGVRAAMAALLRRAGASLTDAADLEVALGLERLAPATALLIADGTPWPTAFDAFLMRFLKSAPQRGAIVLNAAMPEAKGEAVRVRALEKPFDSIELFECLVALDSLLKPASDRNA